MSNQKMIIPLMHLGKPIKANLIAANRIARAAGGELPSVTSDFKMLKTLGDNYDIWTRNGIAVPRKAAGKDGEVVDNDSKIIFQPHSKLQERLEEYGRKHLEVSPAYLFETANGDGWTIYAKDRNGDVFLRPGKESLPNIGICGVDEVKVGVFHLLLDGPMAMSVEDTNAIRMFMAEGSWTRPAIVMPLAITGDSVHDVKYANASNPKTEKAVAVEIDLDLLVERLGKDLEGLKGALRDEIYYPILAAVAALGKFASGEQKP